MAAEVSAPLTQTKKITMVTSNGETGAAKLTGEVVEIMTKLPELVKSLTGIDVAKVSILFRCLWSEKMIRNISLTIIVCFNNAVDSSPIIRPVEPFFLGIICIESNQYFRCP